MYLIVSIDTEEDMPNWRPEKPVQVKNILALPEFHRLLRSYHIKPTYLVDWPVLENRESLQVIKSLLKSEEIEVGAHIHAWNTPPITLGEGNGQATYLSNHPGPICQQKLQNFNDFFVRKLGFQPTSHRAGRYGFNQTIAGYLADLGYTVDSSIAPLMDYRDDGGPYFYHYDSFPFSISGLPHAVLLEVPITIALVHPFSSRFKTIYFRTPNGVLLKKLFHRLNLARLLWLRPTTYTFEEMRQIADFVLDKMKCPILNMMFHSSELYPGTSPYNRTVKDVRQFHNRLEQILSYLRNTRKLESITLTDVASLDLKSFQQRDIIF